MAKKGKTTKKARGWLENGFELFAEVLADLENNFSISLEILSLKHTVNNEVFEYIKNILEMEMDSKLLKQNIADHVKGNATKLEYTNYGKNINGCLSFIQKLLM